MDGALCGAGVIGMERLSVVCPTMFPPTSEYTPLPLFLLAYIGLSRFVEAVTVAHPTTSPPVIYDINALCPGSRDVKRSYDLWRDTLLVGESSGSFLCFISLCPTTHLLIFCAVPNCRVHRRAGVEGL